MYNYLKCVWDSVMMMYLEMGTFCALHVEFATYLGWTPVFKHSVHEGEHIYDLPFTRGIFTPKKCHRAQTAHNMADSIDDRKHNTDPVGAAANIPKHSA